MRYVKKKYSRMYAYIMHETLLHDNDDSWVEKGEIYIKRAKDITVTN